MEEINLKTIDVFGSTPQEEQRKKGLEDINARMYAHRGGAVDEDGVYHPPHYGGSNNPHEAIKVIESWDLNFHAGNVVKYISRYRYKDDPLQDLKKALWYLERLIEVENRKNESS